MKFKYVLPEEWRRRAAQMEEFANGAAQVSIRLRSGDVARQVLISNATSIVAMRERDDLPFSVDDITEIFQTDEDRNPLARSGWKFWDDWS